jgi:hypothetical protein
MATAIEGIRSRAYDQGASWGLTPDARAGGCRHRLSGWRGPAARLAAAPAPSLTVAWASPPSSARLGGRDDGLDAGGAEGDPGAVVHRPRLGDQARHLDRVALAQTRGQAGHLDRENLGLPSPSAMSCTTYRGSPLPSARGCRVSKSKTGWGSRAHRNAIAEVSTGSFKLSLLPLRTIPSAEDLSAPRWD